MRLSVDGCALPKVLRDASSPSALTLASGSSWGAPSNRASPDMVPEKAADWGASSNAYSEVSC